MAVTPLRVQNYQTDFINDNRTTTILKQKSWRRRPAGKRGNFISAIDTYAQVLLPFYFHAEGTAQEKTHSVPLQGLQLLGLSEHRDKYTVTSCGYSGIKGFTNGHSMFAGTIGFSIANQNPFAEVIFHYNNFRGIDADTQTSPLALPPIDIQVVLLDNYFNPSIIHMEGVVFVDRTSNIMVEDVRLTEMYSYMARKVSTLIDPTLSGDNIDPEIRLGRF